MAVNSISGGVYSFSGGGSLASIRKQAEAIKERAAAARAARTAEQEETGLIRNPDTGEMVELSSITEETRERWNDREEMKSISPGEAYILFKAADPNAESVERSKELGAKAAKIQNKMLAGQKLTGAEKSFLKEHFPELAATAARMEMEAEQLERRLRSCKSKEEAQQAYMDAKMGIMSGADPKDGSILFYMAAIDKTYSQYMKQGASSEKTMDVLV